MSLLAVNIAAPTAILKLFLPDMIKRGSGRAGTKLFAHPVDPLQVAKDGFDGMMKGKLNVTSGLPGWQKPMMTLAPLFPKIF